MISADSKVQSAALVNHIKESGYKNVLAIADILPIDQETGALTAEAATAGGFTFTKMPDTFGFDLTDFQPILNKMMEQYRALNSDAVVLLVNPIAAPTLYKGLRDLGVTVPIVGGSATAHPAIFAQGPPAVEGLLIADPTGVLNPATLPDAAPNKAMLADFVKRYTDKYGNPPDMFSTMGADYVTVLAAALKAGGDDKEKVRQALVNTSNLMTLEGADDLHAGEHESRRHCLRLRVPGQERGLRIREHTAVAPFVDWEGRPSLPRPPSFVGQETGTESNAGEKGLTGHGLDRATVICPFETVDPFSFVGCLEEQSYLHHISP
jgi:ABC-type branched-subunit amino acid transport system substrate-binding protein